MWTINFGRKEQRRFVVLACGITYLKLCAVARAVQQIVLNVMLALQMFC